MPIEGLTGTPPGILHEPYSTAPRALAFSFHRRFREELAMSNYGNNPRTTANNNPTWQWIAGIVAIIVVIGGVYALSDRNGPSTASNGTAGSTAEATATGSGGGTAGTAGNAGTPARTQGTR